MPLSKIHRLMIIGSSGVGKTAIIEHLIFGNHIIGVVRGRDLYKNRWKRERERMTKTLFSFLSSSE